MTAWVREIVHTADAGAEITGKDAAEVFAGAIEALYSIMGLSGTGPDRSALLSGSTTWRLKIMAPDMAALLVAFINEALFLFETEGALFDRIRLDKTTETSDGFEAEISARGESYDRLRHGDLREVKAATLHRSSFVKEGALIVATVFFDM